MKIYKSTPPYIMIILPMSMIFVQLISNTPLTQLSLIVNLIVLYIALYFTWISFEVHEKYLVRNYVVRPFWGFKKFSYNEIYSIEVRRNERSRFPYIIIHFNKEDENSIRFLNRSFMYFSGKGVENFVLALKNKGVPIKINIDKGFKKDLLRFNKLLDSSSDLQNPQ